MKLLDIYRTGTQHQCLCHVGFAAHSRGACLISQSPFLDLLSVDFPCPIPNLVPFELNATFLWLTILFSYFIVTLNLFLPLDVKILEDSKSFLLAVASF